MTDDERRERDWVSIRAECTLARMFNDLAKAMGRDVENFNKLPSEKRNGRMFGCQQEESSWVLVAEATSHGTWLGNGRQVRVSVRSSDLEVDPEGTANFRIAHKWNADTSKCHLEIDGRQLSVDRVSQHVLGDLLFSE